MLSIHQVSKSFNLNTILNQISFSVMGGERVGLIGPNGVGKSTLLRIIAGHESADTGQVILTPSTARIGYLAQGFEFDPALSIEEIIASVAEDPAVLEATLAELGAALAAEPERDDLQDAFDVAVAKLSRIDAGRRQQLLSELGLGEIDLGQPAGYLSGGQKTRLSLALLLLDEPDLLLLDEPTNHLDIEMLEWLENWLHGFNGALLAVSHDRTFLDEVVTTIIDIDPDTHRCKTYAGGYSAYIEAFQADLDRQWTAYREQTATIRRMRQDINRTFEQARSVERSTTPRQPNVRRLAKKVAKKAKSREKKLDRYIDSDERVDKPTRSWQMKLTFDEERHIGRDVLFIEDLSVGYGNHPPLLTNLNLSIQAGERVILSGANGSGKTSLLRTVMAEIPPQSGAIRLGGSVIIGYMSQEQELLDDQLTAVETIEKHAATAMNETEIRSFLHFFLFKDEAPTRLIRELSFGERARLALATLVARGCTFLVLDEPINHLDIPSRTRFEQALQSYEGTILAVVHDRFFIHQFATKIWEVKDGKITVTHK